MKANSHLTPEGLDQIRRIKDGMNKGRKVNMELQAQNFEPRDLTILTLDSGSSESNLELLHTKKISKGYEAKLSSLDNQIKKTARLNIILESKMEKVFHPLSFGFNRPGRSVHDALSVVQRMMGIS